VNVRKFFQLFPELHLVCRSVQPQQGCECEQNFAKIVSYSPTLYSTTWTWKTNINHTMCTAEHMSGFGCLHVISIMCCIATHFKWKLQSIKLNQLYQFVLVVGERCVWYFVIKVPVACVLLCVDILRTVLRCREPLHAASNLLGESDWAVQGQEATWSSSTCLFNCRPVISQHAARLAC